MPEPGLLSALETANEESLTRRQVLARLGAGALFIYTAGSVNGDEEKNGIRKQVLLTSRLHVSPEGIVTVLTGKVECGQGIRTTLTQVAAEELELPPASVRLMMGDTALVPDDGGTWGSLTTPETVPVIRQACAAMRELLCRKAAEHWQVEPDTLKVVNGSIAGHGALTLLVSRSGCRCVLQHSHEWGRAIEGAFAVAGLWDAVAQCEWREYRFRITQVFF